MRAGSGFIVVVLLASLPANLRGQDRRPKQAVPQIAVTKAHLDFRHGDQLFTRYQIGEKVAKPYFFPLYAGPDKGVTRAWPMEKDPEVKKIDHPHQKSLWFCHGDVIPEGLDYVKHTRGVAGIDFWAEGKGHGKIVCTAVAKSKRDLKSDPISASVVTTNE